MRAFVAVILCFGALAACDEGVTPASSSITPEAANTAAMKSAAEDECAVMTNHTPDKLRTMTAEMQELVTREYKSCVDTVTRGDRRASRPGN
jgi:hypothetical protein